MINAFTGEVLETPQELHDYQAEINGLEKNIRKSKIELQEALKNLLGSDTGRYTVQATVRKNRSYSNSIIREVFDQDMQDLIFKPQLKMVDQLRKELDKDSDVLLESGVEIKLSNPSYKIV